MSPVYQPDDGVPELAEAPIPISPRDLAYMILNWGDIQRQANFLAEQIEQAVLAEAKTVTVGEARATYSKGRSAYLWEKTCRNNPKITEAIIHDAKVQPAPPPPPVVFVNWEKVAQLLGIEKGDIERGPATPSVKMKLL